MTKKRRQKLNTDLFPIMDPVDRRNYADRVACGGHNDVFPAQIITKWERQMGRAEDGKLHKRPPQPKARNGRNDPFSIMAVTDTLLRCDHRSFVTALQLTGLLEEAAPWLWWDSYTVGRILHSLAELAYNAHHSDGLTPFEVVYSSGQRNYIMPQDLKSWLWLGQIREIAGKLVEEEAEAPEFAKIAPRNDLIWEYALAEARWGDPVVAH